MLRALLKRLAPFRPKPGPSAGALAPEADRLIAAGRQAEDAGDLRAACERYRQAIALAPEHPAAHLNLGIALEGLGDLAAAQRMYEAALAVDPGNAYANYNLGKLHFQIGAFAPAERHLRAALEHKADLAEAQLVLAAVLEARGDLEGAVAAFEVATRQRPQDFGGWFRYAVLLLKLGRDADAESALQRALQLDPASADAHGTLADLYQSRGDFAAAARHLAKVIEQRPDWPDALFHYAHALMRLQRFDDARSALVRASTLDPDREHFYEAQVDLLQRGGRIQEALALCRTRRQRAPDAVAYETSELFTLNFDDTVSAEAVFAQHKAFGERLEKAVAPRFLPFRREPDPDRRLRIGYVGEFYLHPVARFMIPLLEQHDRSRFAVHCYSVGTIADSFTRRVEAASEVWHDAKSMTDSELADVVDRECIDVLVDLSGHSGASRLAVFAERPAPVQATWLGNPNTTGLTRIQYRISDSVCDPPGLTERLHTEELVRLPHAQWCYRPFVAVEVGNEARGAGVTFGSFTQIAKLTPQTRSLWSTVLREVPDARLLVAGVPEDGVREELLDALARDGVDRSRVALRPFMSLQDYMRTFNEVDIALDPAPYSGGTTTCDALWMGVPVLTLPGVRPASRSAASILTAVGLEDWIAASPEDYVRRAARFASGGAVAALRRSLRERMRASPLMQEARFARDIEQAYRTMWHRWCSGERG